LLDLAVRFAVPGIGKDLEHGDLSSWTIFGRSGDTRSYSSDTTFYNWRKKYAGLLPSEMKRLRQLEEENAKLKRIVADLSLDKAMLQDVLAKKL